MIPLEVGQIINTNLVVLPSELSLMDSYCRLCSTLEVIITGQVVHKLSKNMRSNLRFAGLAEMETMMREMLVMMMIMIMEMDARQLAQ
jgi:LytS/YehU family sensor histidine kinase